MEAPPPIATSYQSASVDYTLDEFVEFNLQLYAPQIRSENITFIALGIIGVIGFVWALAASERLLAILSLTTAIWFLGRSFLKKEMIKTAAKKIHDNPSSWLRTKRTVALSTEGVKSEGEDGSYNFTPWRSVRRVIQGTLIDILVLDSNMGIIVPRRAFPDERARQDFVQFARESLVFGEKAP